MQSIMIPVSLKEVFSKIFGHLKNRSSQGKCFQEAVTNVIHNGQC